MAKKSLERPVLVTTSYRGVFFGYVTDYDGGDAIYLKRVRNCLYWPREQKGFLGLAANGPASGCRVGPAADGYFRGVTSVCDVSPEAAKRWEEQPWS